MHTIADLTTTLNRSAAYLQGLQSRFELPSVKNNSYSDAYLVFLQKLVYLRTLSISEETLRDLWRIEKKLLRLLHADSATSPTWFLDACSAKTNPQRRLLLTNYDLGVTVPPKVLQLGLDFDKKTFEFFRSKEMSEDGLEVLNDYLRLTERIRADVAKELPLVQAAVKLGTRL